MLHADTPLRRMMIAVDIHHYSSRDPLGQVDVQQALVEVLNSAADAVHLDRSLWSKQPQGDAELAVLPPQIDEAAVVADYPRELATSLRRHNRSLNTQARLRVRVAMHCGMLHMGALGYPGSAPVETCRLLDAPMLKTTLAESDDIDLALIVSEQLFKDVVLPGYRGLRPELFRKVPVTVKEYSGIGYITIPGLGPPHLPSCAPHMLAATPPAGDTVPSYTARAMTFGPKSEAIGGDKNIYYREPG
jgi:hypothetical protein